MASRERIAKRSEESLSNRELFALIIGEDYSQGYEESVSSCLDRTFSDDLSKISADSLLNIEKLNARDARRILAAKELFSRKRIPQRKISSPKDALVLVEDVKQRRQEHFITVTLNGAGCVIQKRTVFVGTLNKSLVHPREIFAAAISDRASGIIIMHNHPSGEVEPSKEDTLVTEKLQECGRILGIEIIDHVIFSEKKYYSFKENGAI
ncbi:MAG: DNA repair protein RadC [bacterium]|nr:DNA repair protein RadC [bacterium]